MVAACVACSFALALIGPERVLALRDQLIGHTPEERSAALGQIIGVIRGEEVWPVPDRGRLTILLMGIDRRPDQNGAPVRSDAITLVTIDPQAKTAALLSIPRDLYVPLAGLNRVDRINTAYFFGGVQAARDTIAWNLSVPIQGHFVINFDGFEQAIDALGGIDIDVPETIVDDAYPTDDYRTEKLVIPAGPTHMDGDLALKYARTRHGDSDFGRMQRQQQIMLAVRDKALGLDILPKIPALLDALSGSYETDLTVAEMLSIARVWGDIPRERIAAYRIDETMATSWTTPTGGNVLIPRREAIAAVVQAFLAQNPPPLQSH
jgi:LCP family protein required for cell wall assembly